MLSDSERRRLEEMEALLGAEDRTFVAHFDQRRARRVRARLVVAFGVTALGVAVTVLGLISHSVAVPVVGVCLVGVAAGTATWKHRHLR